MDVRTGERMPRWALPLLATLGAEHLLIIANNSDWFVVSVALALATVSFTAGVVRARDGSRHVKVAENAADSSIQQVRRPH